MQECFYESEKKCYENKKDSYITQECCQMVKEFSYEKQREKFKQSIASIIKAHRLGCKKSIYLISNEIGMTRTMWNDLEHSKKDPQLSTLWRVAEGLNIPLSKIIIELEAELGNDFSLIE